MIRRFPTKTAGLTLMLQIVSSCYGPLDWFDGPRPEGRPMPPPIVPAAQTPPPTPTPISSCPTGDAYDYLACVKPTFYEQGVLCLVAAIMAIIGKGRSDWRGRPCGFVPVANRNSDYGRYDISEPAKPVKILLLSFLVPSRTKSNSALLRALSWTESSKMSSVLLRVSPWIRF